MKTKNIGVVSLGCNKNQVDTELMLFPLVEAGYVLVSDGSVADLLIINTCGFIDRAKEESIQAIIEGIELKKEGKPFRILVTGCLSQRYQEELVGELPEVDGFLGVSQYGEILSVVERILAGERVIIFDRGAEPSGKRVLIGPKHSVSIRIAEGCSTGCSYCAIPLIRGGYRSRPMQDILSECSCYQEQGVQEVVLIAQDTSYYGTDSHHRLLLPQLLESIAETGIPWIRLLYTYPERIGADLLSIMDNYANIVPYLDMPVQHIDDRILKQMGRPSTEENIRNLLEQIAGLHRPFTLRTSLITGFPGETEEQHEASVRFVEEGHFHHLGVFSYSAEEGTRAAGYPSQLLDEVKEERRIRLMEAQKKVSQRKNQERIGTEETVLVDEYLPDLGLYLGHTAKEVSGEADGDIYLSTSTELAIGSFVTALVTDEKEYDLFCEVRDEPV